MIERDYEPDGRLKMIRYAFIIPILFATAAFSQVATLEQGFMSLERYDRERIQCILNRAGNYDGSIDGIYGPETEAALLASYARIGSYRVARARGGLNTEREVYYFLFGFTDEDWGYESLAIAREYCVQKYTERDSRSDSSVQSREGWSDISKYMRKHFNALSASERIDLQSRLKFSGFYQGAIDARWGSMTEEAILAFYKNSARNLIGEEGDPNRLSQMIIAFIVGDRFEKHYILTAELGEEEGNVDLLILENEDSVFTGYEIPYGSRAGMNVTAISERGLGTNHAEIFVKHTAENAKKFCTISAFDESSACVSRVLEMIKVEKSITANCAEAIWSDANGNRYTLLGQQEGNLLAEYSIKDLDSGEVLDGTSASGYHVALATLKSLCPQAFSYQ